MTSPSRTDLVSVVHDLQIYSRHLAKTGSSGNGTTCKVSPYSGPEGAGFVAAIKPSLTTRLGQIFGSESRPSSTPTLKVAVAPHSNDIVMSVSDGQPGLSEQTFTCQDAADLGQVRDLIADTIHDWVLHHSHHASQAPAEFGLATSYPPQTPAKIAPYLP